jgi:CRP/FNR family cyclic AMP-dependent transcriptional regulator
MKQVLSILGLLSDSDIDWLVSAGERVDVPLGVEIITEGKHSGRMFIVLEGDVEIIVNGAAVASMGQGEVLGEISLLDSRPPTATVRAGANAQVLQIAFDKLKPQLDADSGFAARLYRALAVFLAQRMRARTEALKPANDRALDDDVELPDEIDPDVMEEISRAGDRFKWMMDRLKSH